MCACACYVCVCVCMHVRVCACMCVYAFVCACVSCGSCVRVCVRLSMSHSLSPSQDGKLSADEVVDAFDIFIDSQVTDFGHSIHDEL